MGIMHNMVLLAACLSFMHPCMAAETIPHEAARYRADVVRQSRLVWGLGAPVATFAAQIHTESRWRSDAASRVGARGLAQFMPATERWIANTDPELNIPRRGSTLGATDSVAPQGALNPVWAIRALVSYDYWLFDRVTAQDDCQRMAMALSAYNGGLGWVYRDAALAPGKGPGSANLKMRWFDGVERYNAGRSTASFNENRAYPRLILQTREPLYEAAGWGTGVCP